MHFTDGIILKKDQYREADFLITVLTKDFGKIRLAARGVRKQEAKLRGHIEVLMRSFFGFVLTKSGYRLTSADMKECYPNIRSHPELMRATYSVFRLIDANTFEEREDPRLFEITLAFLLEMERGDDVTPEALNACLYRFYALFLDISGLLPDPTPLETSAIDAILATHLGFKTETLLI
ncbi:MAG: repair protein RecO protein [Parcubacteria group bacterium GW2011_GWA2_47_10]|nr:MAG: repair protein RecO protein [Parcubacteria group bacterium GW2011_GWA2_47_10]